jgi:molecular chaperone HtpG
MKGNIRVQAENIFPIIKKFLYSDHEIFVRELISNAVDATQKLRKLSSIGEPTGDIEDVTIEVKLDAEQKTITISDRGVGMSQEEVEKYINQVAFSGAEEFVNKYKDASIIGHFGLGFYSSFMVSDKVEIFTKSFKADAPAVRWECDGSPEYVIETVEKEQRGTDIVLHISEESKEFLDEYRIKSILDKFCKFLPVPIKYKDEQINNVAPAWVKKPSELTKEDYEKFYKELYPFGETPLFWIHLNVDYPFNLTGILYFPKIKQTYEIQKDKIQLYCNQVFVTDEVKEIVPEFLMLMHGVIDSPDIPLNVSRSYLQGDPNVKKINAHITKKVADKLDELFRNERAEYENKWQSLGLFVKYGMLTDEKFYDKAKSFLLLEDAAGDKFYTLEEYRTAAAALQTNKDQKLTVLYATDAVQQDSYITAAKAKGFCVVKLNDLIDQSFLNHAESKMENIVFKRVDADIADNLVDVAENNDSVLSEAEVEQLKTMFEVKKDGLTATVEVKGLSAEMPPVVATRPELSRRMKDMANVGGGSGMFNFYAQMPDEVTLTVNGNHEIYKKILANDNADKQHKMVQTLADMALLSQGLLKGNDLTSFISRNVELLKG